MPDKDAVTLLYHAKTVGHICKRIAETSKGKVKAVCDKTLPTKTKPTLDGTVIRWDSRVPVNAHNHVNPSAAIKLSRNKRESRLKLGALAPTTWTQLHKLSFPCIIRPQRHYAARRFYVCKDMLAAAKAAKKAGIGWYASPVINKAAEYRIFVFQDRAIKVIRRYPPKDGSLAWNSATGGTTKRVLLTSWPIDAVKKAIEAGRPFELGWYAADVILDQAGKAYVLELNTAPGLKRKKTIETLAKLFSSQAKVSLPVCDLTGKTWKKLRHPGLKEQAE